MKTEPNAYHTEPAKARYNRRASWHDYSAPCIYMVTLTCRAHIPPLSVVSGPPISPSVTLTPIGKGVADLLLSLPKTYPALRIYEYVIMPDHIHFVVHVTEHIDYHLGKVIGAFKGACSRLYWASSGVTDVSIFNDGFHDRILRHPRQLEVMERYIADNPRRLLVKRAFPDLYRRRAVIIINDTPYDCLGNIFLLRNPEIVQVQVSRRFDDKKRLDLHRLWCRTIAEGGVLVSPFISPDEKRYQDMAIANDGKLILLVDNGMHERYKPGGRYFDLCAKGRLLIIAPQQHQMSAQHLTRDKALFLNELAAIIAKGDFAVTLKN